MADVIAELVARLGYEVDDTGLNRFSKGTDDASNKAGDLTKKLRSGTNALAKWTAGVVAAGAALVGHLISSVAEAGDEIAKTSVQLATNSTELQRMRFAAERSGASAATLDKAIKKLNVGLLDATVKGTGPASEALEILGMKAKDLEGLTTEQKMGAIADSLQQVEDGNIRAALAAKLFGERSGAELKPLLDLGSEGMRGLGDRAEELGGVLGEDALKNAEAFQDGLLDMKTAAFGAGASLVEGLVPMVTDAANGIANWVAENDEFISQDLPAFLEMVGEGAGEVITFFLDAATQVDDFVAEVEDLVELIDEEYGDSIDAAIDAGQSLIDLWGDIAGAIGKGVAKLLEFVDVLDDANETVYSIKVGLGLDDTPTTNVRGGQTFLGGPTNENNRRNEQRRERDRERAEAKRAAEEDRKKHEAELKRLAKSDADRERAKKQAEFAKRFERLSNKGKGGRGGKKKGIDTSAADSMFGDRLRDLSSFAGGSDKTTSAALEAAAKALEEGATSSQAFAAGVGRLESLTGATLQTDSIGSALEGAILGGGGGRAGGGSSPTAGARFVRIDASFNAPTTIELVLPDGAAAGLGPRETLELVEATIGEALEERNRKAYDHFRRNVEV